MRSTIRIEPPTTSPDGTTVECRFSVEGPAAQYFKERPFYTTYDGIDVRKVPDGINVIPALSTLAPMAWVLDADLVVSEVDRSFARSLESIRRVFQVFYPNMAFRGDHRFDRLTDAEKPVSDGDLLFFSGGVDSTASYLRLRDRGIVPTLVTVLGADIPVANTLAWDSATRTIGAFARREGVRSLTIRSNLREIARTRAFEKAYPFNEYPDYGYWWPQIQHALGIVGLAAPLSAVIGATRIHLAATDCWFFEKPWGSHPLIENNIEWGHHRAFSEGHEIIRHDKIAAIARAIENGRRDLAVRTCWRSARGDNCGECSCCGQLFAALLSEGLDPERHGVSVSEGTMTSIMAGLKPERLAWVEGLDESEVFCWLAIQKRLARRESDIPERFRPHARAVLAHRFDTYGPDNILNHRRVIRLLADV